MPIAALGFPWEMAAEHPWFNEGSSTTMVLWSMGYVIGIRHDAVVGGAGKIDPEGRVRESHL